MSIDHPDRHIPLEGAENFRELGGYETADGRVVRWRMLYRADGLGGLTDGDVAQLLERGVATVFDLRSSREVEAFGQAVIAERGAAYHHVPFRQDIGLTAQQMTDPERMANAARSAGYLEMLEHAKPSIGRVFRALVEEEPYGAVFHCTGGKDRTGITAALILHTLGVPDETIAADYALTSRYLTFSDERRKTMEEFFGITFPTTAFASDPETILETLGGVAERYGSVARYLEEECAVSAEHQEALRGQLLEERDVALAAAAAAATTTE
jgi:protein-tyrosine phosphatase